MTAPLVSQYDRKPDALIALGDEEVSGETVARKRALMGPIPGQLWERTAEATEARAAKALADAAEMARVNALLDTVLGEEPKL